MKNILKASDLSTNCVIDINVITDFPAPMRKVTLPLPKVISK